MAHPMVLMLVPFCFVTFILGKQNKSKTPVAGCNTGLVRELSSESDSCENSSGCIGAVDASDIHLGKHRLYCYAMFVILIGVFCSAKN